MEWYTDLNPSPSGLLGMGDHPMPDQPTLFPMVKHHRCTNCGCVMPRAEFVSIDMTLEDDEPNDPVLLHMMRCPHCNNKISPQAEPYAFPFETYAPPCIGAKNGVKHEAK